LQNNSLIYKISNKDIYPYNRIDNNNFSIFGYFKKHAKLIFTEVVQKPLIFTELIFFICTHKYSYYEIYIIYSGGWG